MKFPGGNFRRPPPEWDGRAWRRQLPTDNIRPNVADSSPFFMPTTRASPARLRGIFAKSAIKHQLTPNFLKNMHWLVVYAGTIVVAQVSPV